MKQQQCSNCVFSSWYHNFKQVTIKSKIIKLSSEFVHYLKSDGIILPDAEEVRYSNDLERYSDDEDDTWDNAEDTPTVSKFPDLKLEIDNAISDLGGVVFPKLNWSCPKDAAWISHNGTLKCTSFNDICLLLKSSDFITHDLTKPYEYCEDSNITHHPDDQYELVLRRWCEVIPGMEFRCFVKANKLVGISQRHHSSFFEYLPTNKEVYSMEIINFYNSKIKGKFADSDYIFDIYKNGEKYCVIDFNPFGEKTDSLLFSWTELNTLDASVVDEQSEGFFRVISDSNGIQPSPYNSYAIPKDMVDLKSGEDINKMVDFFNLKNLISNPGDE